MSKLEIEIKESEYLIRLKKGEFDLVQIQRILNQFMNFSNVDFSSDQPHFVKNRSAELMDRFDCLSDK